MMNNFIGLDTRSRRNLNNNSFPPIHVSVSNYSTNAHTKESMKDTYNTMFLNNLHLIPDPLKKNLADSVITEKNMNKTKTEQYLAQKAKKPSSTPSLDIYPKLRSIISGVVSVMGAMFQWRDSSPSSQYYDCFDSEYIENSDEQMSGSVPWQTANHDVQNNNGWAQSMFDGNNESNWKSEMITDCNPALTDDQISQVCLFLNSDTNYIQIPCPTTKKCFEPGSADVFEDAYCPEEFSSAPCKSYLDYHSPFYYEEKDLLNSHASNLKTEEVKEEVQVSEKNKNCLNTSENIVTSCEDKLNRIKALLKSKCTKQKESIENNDNNNGKIIDDTVFGNEIKIPKSQCVEISDHFNEVTGKFYSSSVESDDSFQIVFTDDARECRRRIPSECESEDSFIVFEESPESCYITDDIFGDEPVDSDSDSETSDSEDDSGCDSTKLFPNLSRTVEDLTDDRLYSEDAVDGSIRIGEHYCSSSLPYRQLPKDDTKTPKTYKQDKKVRFSSDPPKVHVMRVWAFAAKQARIGEWEQHARDRDRFKSRINDVEMAISWVLKPQHRKLVMFQRFMPWWNAQKRKELEEKKQLEEKEKLKAQQLEETKLLGDETQVEEKSQEKIESVETKQLEEVMQLKDKKVPDKTVDMEETEQLKYKILVQEKLQEEEKKESIEKAQLQEVKQFKKKKAPDKTVDMEKTEQLKDKVLVQEKLQEEEKKESIEKTQLVVVKQFKEKKAPDKTVDMEDTEQLKDIISAQEEEKIESVEKIQLQKVKQLEEMKTPDNMTKPEPKDTENIQFGLIKQIRQNYWDDKDKSATEQSSMSDR